MMSRAEGVLIMMITSIAREERTSGGRLHISRMAARWPRRRAGPVADTSGREQFGESGGRDEGGVCTTRREGPTEGRQGAYSPVLLQATLSSLSGVTASGPWVLGVVRGAAIDGAAGGGRAHAAAALLTSHRGALHFGREKR